MNPDLTLDKTMKVVQQKEAMKEHHRCKIARQLNPIAVDEETKLAKKGLVAKGIPMETAHVL